MASSNDDRITALLSRVDELSRPRLAKPEVPTWKAHCQHRARLLFERAIADCGFSHREVARRLGVDESTLRDWLTNSRKNIPAWAVLALPKPVQLAFVRAQLSALPEEDCDTEQTERVA